MVSVAVVGAGFSGLCMALKLKAAGIQCFTIYEAADDIGGTWRQNQYPDKYDLSGHIRLNTRVTGAAWDAERAVWQLSTVTGQQQEVQLLILAQGPLSVPAGFDILGLSDFQGPILHTAAWDSSVELAGKKVAVVGTGASAIQIVPQLQQVAQELVVFQRTPAWVLPRQEFQIPFMAPAAQSANWLTQWLHKQLVYWRSELVFGAALVTNNWAVKNWLRSVCLRNMKRAVKDPQLQAQLTPSYEVGCKRVLLSDDYYPAIASPNVKLVPAGLKQVAEGKGHSVLEAADGNRVSGVDVIVAATGFDLTAPLTRFDIVARGSKLSAVLESKPEAFLGTAIAGFPNMFTLLGYNTGLGHHSVIFIAECQINLIMKLIREHMLPKGWETVEVSPAAQHSFNTEIQSRLQRSVWMSGCNSWYLTKGSAFSADSSLTAGSKPTVSDIAPNGSVNGGSGSSGGQGISSSSSGNCGSFILWPGLCTEFWWKTLQPRAGDWVFGTAAAAAADICELVKVA